MPELMPSSGGGFTIHHASYPSISPATNPALSMASKTVLITGAGSGAGLAMLRSFAVAGAAHIGIIGRRLSVLESAASSISAGFPATKISVYAADIADEAAIDTAFAAFEKVAGKIDIGVHNAGYCPPIGLLTTLDVADVKTSIDTNILGSLYFIRAFLRAAAPEAVLVYVSSAIVHMAPMAGWSGYTTFKGAATSLFSFVGVENPGIRVHTIHPGVLLTEMSARNVPVEQQGLVDWDELALPGDFTVWISSPQAKFLDGRFVWANWDVEEMKGRAGEIEEKGLLRMGLVGWP